MQTLTITDTATGRTEHSVAATLDELTRVANMIRRRGRRGARRSLLATGLRPRAVGQLISMAATARTVGVA